MFRFGARSPIQKRAHEFASYVIKNFLKNVFVNFLTFFFFHKKDVKKLKSFLKTLKSVHSSFLHSSFLHSPFLVLVTSRCNNSFCCKFNNGMYYVMNKRKSLFTCNKCFFCADMTKLISAHYLATEL